MGGSNSEIAAGASNGNTTTDYNEQELADFFADLELGIINTVFSETPPSSSTSTNNFCYGSRNNNYNDDHHSRFLQGRSTSIFNTNDVIMDDLINYLLHSPDSFIAAALDEKQTFAVQQLIKQAKNSSVATLVTLTLSTRFYQVMTHKIGKHVIKQCLVFLGNNANQVLFEKAIDYFYELATHKEGCISLNECINYISGPQRERLLLNIADKSAYLSYDPTGNFVVQHVLSVDNQVVTEIICRNLRTHYVRLSLNQRGSHVVEKCISCSIHGMRYAVEELLKKEKQLCQVARNEFGNYVVQMALNTTRVYDIDLYKSLVKAIEEHSSYIEKSKFGRNVIYLIRVTIPNRWLNQGQYQCSGSCQYRFIC